MPYVIEGPGPTFDVLGSSGKQRIISIKDAPTYPTKGELRMVTVSMRGGPGYHVTGFEVAWAMLSGKHAVYPVSEIYPDNVSAEDVRKQADAQMEGSQKNAEVAALEELGYSVPARLKVVAVDDASPVKDAIKTGDVITGLSINGESQETTDAGVLFRALESASPSDEIVLSANREGKTITARGHGKKRPDGEGVMLGLYLDPQVSMPVDISVGLSDVGGPSAGMMFALGMIDELTPGALTGGKVIAGTGALSMGGGVQMISGVPQKMAGAKRDGASWFLLPRGNCAEAAGHVPEGMRAVPVTTLEQARDVVEAIGKDETENLPTCPRG